AEDGIRDYKVTGVQTCALPIFRRSCGNRARESAVWGPLQFLSWFGCAWRRRRAQPVAVGTRPERSTRREDSSSRRKRPRDHAERSEERRVGKGWRLRW